MQKQKQRTKAFPRSILRLGGTKIGAGVPGNRITSVTLTRTGGAA